MVQPLRSASVLRPSKWQLLGPLPSHRSARFPRSTQKPEPGSRHLSAGHRPASKQVPAGLLHRPHKRSDFDGSCVHSDSSSTVHLRSPSWHSPDGGTPAFSRSVHHLGSHPHAAPGGLRTGPATRPRGALPHLPCSMASVSRSIDLPSVPSWHTCADYGWWRHLHLVLAWAGQNR